METTENLLRHIMPKMAARAERKRDFALMHAQLVQEGKLPFPALPNGEGAGRLPSPLGRGWGWGNTGKYAIAASVLLCIAVGMGRYYWRTQQNQQLYAAAFAMPDVAMIQGAKGVSDGTEWQYAYRQHDYPAAAQQLQACLASATCSPIARLYAGVCYLAMNQPQPAITELTILAQQPTLSAPRRNIALLYLALAHLRANDRAAAAIALQRVDTTVHIPETQTAIRLLQQCNE